MAGTFVPFSVNDFGQQSPLLTGQVTVVRGGLGARIVGFLTFLAVLAIVGTIIVVLLPVALVAVIVIGGLLALLYAWIRLRLWWLRQKSPNGSLDGRRNVRVRTPQQTFDPVDFAAQSRQADYVEQAESQRASERESRG